MLWFVYTKGQNFEPTQFKSLDEVSKSVCTGQWPHPVGKVCKAFEDVTFLNLLTWHDFTLLQELKAIAASDSTGEVVHDVLGDVAIPEKMVEEEFIAFVDMDKEVEVACSREVTDSELLESVTHAKNCEVQDEQINTLSDDENKWTMDGFESSWWQ